MAAHLAAHSTPVTYKFFTEQVSKYNDQLLQIRSAVSNFHREKELYSMPEQQSATLQAFQAADSQINGLEYYCVYASGEYECILGHVEKY